MPKQPSEISPEKLIEPSVEEHEKMPPFFLVYRDNALYKELGPKISDVLTGLGYRVTAQVFPEGTPEDIIKKWYEEHKVELEGARLVDQTFRRSTGDLTGSSLDGIVEGATKDVVLGLPESEWRGDVDIERVKEVFVRLLQRVLEAKKNIPSKVFVFAEKITDHEPFCFKRTSEGGVVLAPDGNPERIPNYKKADPHDVRYATSRITEWLVEAGIPEENISVEMDMKDPNKKDIINQQDFWLISDRHYYPFGFDFSTKIESKVLNFPLFDFLRSLIKKQLLHSTTKCTTPPCTLPQVFET